MRCQMPSLFKRWCSHAGQRQACHLNVTLALCAASFSDFVSLSSLMDWCVPTSNRPWPCDLVRRPLVALLSAAVLETRFQCTILIRRQFLYFSNRNPHDDLARFQFTILTRSKLLCFFNWTPCRRKVDVPLYDFAGLRSICFLQSKQTSS